MQTLRSKVMRFSMLIAAVSILLLILVSLMQSPARSQESQPSDNFNQLLPQPMFPTQNGPAFYFNFYGQTITPQQAAPLESENEKMCFLVSAGQGREPWRVFVPAAPSWKFDDCRRLGASLEATHGELWCLVHKAYADGNKFSRGERFPIAGDVPFEKKYVPKFGGCGWN